MLKSNALLALALGGVTLLGCNKDDTKPATPTTPPAVPTPTPQASTPAAPELPGPSTKPSVPDVAVPAIPAIPAAPTTAPSVTAPDAPSADAQSTLDKIEAAIKAKNWDDADSLLKKLEAQKDKLPPEIQSKLGALRTAVDAGKNLKLPGGLPGLPGDNK